MKKLFAISILIFTGLLLLWGFELPQEILGKESFKSYFGQNRGKLLSTSLVYNEPGEVKAAEDGRVLIIINEENDDSDFFPSTLGTAIILAHDDNLLSVYANLSNESITINDINETKVESGTILGETGNTGWQSDKSSLEFQIIDTKKSAAINPKILMPRSDKEVPLSIGGITIQNKNGDYFDLNVNKTFSSGLYKIYERRNSVATPYKTSVTVNGIEVDPISYDAISQENNKISVNGKRKYNSEEIYPTDKLHLLGEAMLTPGKITLGLSASDINGTTRTLNYSINIY